MKHLKQLIIMHLKHQGKSNINSIKIYFFVVLSYPLILCIELQCAVSQQERVAQLLIEIFGEKIYLDHLIIESNNVLNEYRSLPSPNDLRGKIILKVKAKQTC